MTIPQWRKYFVKKLTTKKEFPKNGDCFDMNSLTLQEQLSKIKGKGYFKVYYLKVKTLNEKEFELSIETESIYVDEPQY